MARTFRALSLLLSYPQSEIIAALPDLKQALEQEALLPERERRNLFRLIDDLGGRDLMDAQERYVFLFDRTRSLSLHLFEHVHGESRDRGQAMVDLLAVYEDHGLAIGARELPDYLPLFLEFLSTLPFEEARDFLAQPAQIIAALRERLNKRQSLYVSLFDAILTLAKVPLDPGVVSEILSMPEDDPEDFAALDQIWEEEVVRFGGDNAKPECPGERLNQRLRAALREEAAAAGSPGVTSGGSADA